MDTGEKKMQDNLDILRSKKEIEVLETKQKLAKLRDNEARQLDLTGAPQIYNRDQEQIEYTQELQELAKPKPKPPTFLCSTLSRVVPFVPGSLVLIAAHSGKGKSTVVANIAYSNWKQGLKTLIFSNEEPKKDIRHRIGCIEHGIELGRVKDGSLTGHELMKLSEVTDDTVDYIHVVDQSYKNNGDFVKTIDGFKYVWNNTDFSQYACVIIDYYQNVTRDSRVPSKSPWEVQAELADFLDGQKNVIGIPIFVFAQLKLFSDTEKEFEERLKGRKIIFDKCTFAVELASNKGDYTSEWKVHKDRHHGRDGAAVKTGFDKAFSRFVDRTTEFQEKAAAWVRQRQIENPAFDEKQS